MMLASTHPCLAVCCPVLVHIKAAMCMQGCAPSAAVTLNEICAMCSQIRLITGAANLGCLPTGALET